MLVELSIKDFAIIDAVTIGFGPGLNIFTGETGAGKSIVVDALSLLLGDRATSEIIRGERDEARVEALFDLTGVEGIDEVLEHAGIECADTLIIKRIVQRAGRNRIYINGSLSTLMTLTEVASRLVDIYGQSEHQSLARAEEHIELLDTFGGYGELREVMRAAHERYSGLAREYDKLKKLSGESAERREFLEFQARELGDASLVSGEEEGFEAERARLKNSGLLKRVTAAAENDIYSDSGSVTERLGTHVAELKQAAVIDERLKPVVEAIESATFQLEDAAGFLRGYSEGVESDPDALEAIEARVDLIKKLKKKYSARTVDELIDKRTGIEAELEGMSSSAERLAELEHGVADARQKAEAAAARLTGARTEAAAKLSTLMEEELAGLGMEGSVFEPRVEPDAGRDGAVRISERGADRVTFFISPNPGEEVKPLQRIASGGELSRIMLALKRVTAAGRVPTLLFDEIDTGVGGEISQMVGLKLHEVSGTHQVICITHLPQIAAFAERHFSVSKGRSADGRTVSAVREVSGPGRIDELSVMLGGANVTDTTRKHAEELCDTARALAAGSGAER